MERGGIVTARPAPLHFQDSMGRGKAWWESECVALCQAWTNVAHEDPVTAAAQKPAFFDRLHSEFTTYAPSGASRLDQNGEPRSTVATRAKWKEISRAVIDFDRHLRDVRAEVGANATATDDEYTVLMKAIARQNGIVESLDEKEGVSGGIGVASASPARPHGKSGVGSSSGPGAFEFMSCWQFLRKVPCFWETYVPELNRRMPADLVNLVNCATVAAVDGKYVPAGQADSSTAWGVQMQELGTSGAGTNVVPTFTRAAKRMRTGFDGATYVGRGASPSSQTNRSLEALTEAVLARNDILVEANALTLFSLENMRCNPEAQEYFRMSAELHLADMKERLAAGVKRRGPVAAQAVAPAAAPAAAALPTAASAVPAAGSPVRGTEASTAPEIAVRYEQAAAAAAEKVVGAETGTGDRAAVHDIAAVAAAAAAAGSAGAAASLPNPSP